MENQGYPAQPLPNSTAVLVLGILSIVTCICYGIPGIVMGIIAIVLSSSSMRLYQQDPQAYILSTVSNLRAGKVCAIIGLCLSVCWLLLIIVGILDEGSSSYDVWDWDNWD